MEMKASRSTIIVLVFLVLKGAQADLIIHTLENQQGGYRHHTFQWNGLYYSDSTVYGQSFNAYQRLESDFTLRYKFFENFVVFGRATWSFISLSSETLPQSGMGFNDQTLGVNARLIEQKESFPFDIDIQIQTDFPIYPNLFPSFSAVSFPFGDRSVDTTISLFLAFPFSSHPKESLFYAVLGTGFTYRTLGFPTGLPWSAILQYRQHADGMIGEIGFAGTNSPTSFLAQGRIKLGYQWCSPSKLPVFEIAALATQNTSQNINSQAIPTHGTSYSLQALIHWGGGDRHEKNPLLIQSNQYEHANRGFLNYSLDAKVLKTNDRLSLIKINKGSQDEIEIGQTFDLFSVSKDGTKEEAIARASVTHIRVSESVLKITEFYKNEPIQEGFIAKKLISVSF